MREEVGRAIGLSARKVQVRTHHVVNTYLSDEGPLDLVSGKFTKRQSTRFD